MKNAGELPTIQETFDYLLDHEDIRAEEYNKIKEEEMRKGVDDKLGTNNK